MLAQKMRPHAPSKIQEEINDKILKPLLSVMMTEVERMTFADLAKRNQSGDFTNEEDCFQKALDEPPSKKTFRPKPTKLLVRTMKVWWQTSDLHLLQNLTGG